MASFHRGSLVVLELSSDFSLTKSGFFPYNLCQHALFSLFHVNNLFKFQGIQGVQQLFRSVLPVVFSSMRPFCALTILQHGQMRTQALALPA